MIINDVRTKKLATSKEHKTNRINPFLRYYKSNSQMILRVCVNLSSKKYVC